jgi:polysaccharide pyruvyl transferase CsaB
MPTILIGGYYGAGNIGDEAILESIVNELRVQYEKPADLDLIVLSWDPKSTSRTHNVETIFWKDIDALLDAGLRADLIILGGGGIFHDYWGIDPDTYLRKDFQDITAFGSLPLLAKLLNVPCMIYAVGVGPFNSETAQEHTRMAFERCQAATVRDEESLRYLKETGFDPSDPENPSIKIFPDPVFSMTTFESDEAQVDEYFKDKNIPTDSNLIGVSLRYWDMNTESEDWLLNIAEGLGRFLHENEAMHCVLIPFHALEATPFTNDVPTLQALANHLDSPNRVHVIDEQLTPRFAQALIKQCRMVLGMRFHSVVSAINVGTPMVALSYAPKVWSVMEKIGLEEYCNRTISPAPEVLANQLMSVWEHRDEIQQKLLSEGQNLREQSKEHARLALKQISKSISRVPDLTQEFALQQTRRVYQLETAHDEMEQTREKLQRQIWDLQGQLTDAYVERDQAKSEVELLKTERDQLKRETINLQSILNEIQSSNVWRLGQKYYRLRDNSPLKYLYWFSKTAKREGFSTAIKKTANLRQEYAKPMQPIENKVNAVFYDVVTTLNKRDITGIALLTSAFEFDEFYNQRVINLAKYLNRKGWGVIYVAWVWHDEKEAPPGELMENLFQIPSNYFFEGYLALKELQAVPRFFVAEFPHPNFLIAAIKLRREGFKILYDIVDEWEAFHQVGQAIWYERQIEESFVVNANFITAVSQPLVDKFEFLRKDIHLIPNGFDPLLLGGHKNIAQSHISGSDINLGYFGHLTPSWFDWDFLKEILCGAETKNLNLKISLIGYGEPDLDNILGNYQDRIDFHGRVSPSELFNYAQDWDVAMIPFIHNDLSEAVDPIKIYEYLYFGLPVIVKGIPHLASLPGVSVVSNAEELIDKVIYLKENQHIEQKEIDLNEFTWEKRFSKLMAILEDEAWMSL